MRRLLTLALLATLSVVSAHAHLAASSPAADAVVPTTEAASVITLEFTEGVELGFSTFRLVPIEHQLDVTDDTFAMRLNALAAQKAAEVLGVRGEVEGEIPFQLEPARGTVEKFDLQLAEPLAPGSYVLAWRVLSVDTHVIEAFITFTVAP